MWLIIRKELFEHILTFRFVVGFIACNLLFGVITFVLAQDFELRAEQVQGAKAEEQQRRDGWETWSYVRPTIFKDLSPLSVFVAAGGRQYGASVWISHTRVPVFTSDEASGGEANFLGFFFSFDFVTVAGLFISLLGFLFSFDLVSGEKERATLRILLSYPVQRSILFTGKFVGAFLALATVMLSATLLSVIMLNTMIHAPLSADDWAGFATVFIASLLYGAVFISLGMLISTRLHSTASSLVVCMMVWIGLVLILPSTIALFTSELGFSKDSREFERKLTALNNEQYRPMNAISYDPQDYQLMANIHGGRDGQTCFRIVGPNARKALAAKMPSALQAQNEYAEKRFGLEKDFHAQRCEKSEFATGLLRISPISLYANLLNAAARADAASHENFMEQARRYREEVMAYIRGKGGYTSDRWFTNDHPGALHESFAIEAERMTLAEQGNMFNHMDRNDRTKQFMTFIQASEADPKRKLNISDLPAFIWRQPSLLESLGNSAADIILLVAFIGVCIMLSAISFNSYDPR